MVVGIGLVAAVFFLLPRLSELPVLAALLAGTIYLVSHMLRALRLAILSMDMLGISGRTAALMHFVTAPPALMLPFKTGELLRLHQLWRLSGTAIYAVIALLIDRMYDSLFLVPVLMALLFLGWAPPALTLLTLLAATLPLCILVLGPKLLTEIQRYVLVNHNNPRTLGVLRRIDMLRSHVSLAADVARHRAPELSLLSFLIWACEFLVCLILVNAFTQDLQAITARAMELLGARLVVPWWNTGAAPVVELAMTLAALALILPWPLMILFYMHRRKSEPRRVLATRRFETRMTL